MAQYSSLPLYRQTVELVAHIERAMGKTSRQYRYTFGERMTTTALHLPMDFYRIYDEQDHEKKILLFDTFLQHLKELKTLLDVAHQLGLFTYKDFPVIIEKVDSVERQINGFYNKTAKVSVTKGNR